MVPLLIKEVDTGHVAVLANALPLGLPLAASIAGHMYHDELLHELLQTVVRVHRLLQILASTTPGLGHEDNGRLALRRHLVLHLLHARGLDEGDAIAELLRR